MSRKRPRYREKGGEMKVRPGRLPRYYHICRCDIVRESCWIEETTWEDELLFRCLSSFSR